VVYSLLPTVHPSLATWPSLQAHAEAGAGRELGLSVPRAAWVEMAQEVMGWAENVEFFEDVDVAEVAAGLSDVRVALFF